MLLGLTLLLLSAEPPLPSGVPAPVKGPNPFLSQAKELFANLDFEKCLRRLQQAPQWKTEATELIEIELLAGMCHYNLNQRPDAEERFRLALRMNPDAELPPYSSPKLVDFFLSVKKKLRVPPPPMPKEDLDLQKEKEKEREKERERELQRERDREAQLQRERDRELAEKPKEDEPRVESKPEEDEPRIEPKPKLVPKQKVVVAPPPEVEKPSVFARRPVPIALGAGAVVAAGVGIALGVNARGLEAQAKAAKYETDFYAFGDGARANAMGANVAFGVAGAAALATVITWALSSD